MTTQVVIFGAGSSTVAGIPTTARFLDETRRIVDSGRLRKGLEEVIRDVLTLHDQGPPGLNVEELYSLITTLQSTWIWEERLRGRDFSAQFLIANTILQCMRPTTRAHDAYVRKFLRNDSARATVNFNWDPVLDFAIALEYNVRYGYDGRTETLDRPPKRAEERILLKPHGSLNWWFCPNPDCRRLWVSQTVVHLTRWWTSEQRYRCSCRRRPWLFPAIIPPAASKLTYVSSIPPQVHGPLFHQLTYDVWGDVYDVLESANRVVIVGYSFPLLDQEMLLLVRDAFARNTMLESLEVVTLGGRKHKEKLRKHLRPIVGAKWAKKADISGAGFKAWIADLPMQPRGPGISIDEIRLHHRRVAACNPRQAG